MLRIGTIAQHVTPPPRNRPAPLSAVFNCPRSADFTTDSNTGSSNSASSALPRSVSNAARISCSSFSSRSRGSKNCSSTPCSTSTQAASDRRSRKRASRPNNASVKLCKHPNARASPPSTSS